MYKYVHPKIRSFFRQIHAQTRKRELVEILHRIGLSVSHDRVLSLSAELGNAACEHFETDKVVCPLKLRSGVFMSVAVDNTS